MTPDFKLNPDFLAGYASRPVQWGFTDAGGTSLGELTFLNKYSHIKPDGTKETWAEVCQRVVEGMFTLQKRHCARHRLPWHANKAQRAAQEAYIRMFEFKWTPPGRGIDHMGRPIVMDNENGAPLQNCAFVSTGGMTKRNPAEPFVFLMEASMYGVGVGFDTLGADLNLPIYPRDPVKASQTFVVPDTREGWAEATHLLINSFLIPGSPAILFDYRSIRPKGAPIQTLGGVAAGPGPLIELHDALTKLFVEAQGTTLTADLIVDIGNLIGRCVVAGNMRRSAELALGRLTDTGFIDLKNADRFPRRNGMEPGERGWAWLSNNSVQVSVGDDLSTIIPGIIRNGEPGVIWMDTSRAYGRLIDAPNHKDHRAAGYNPCFTADTGLMTADGWTTFGAATGAPYLDIMVDGRVSYTAAPTAPEHPANWRVSTGASAPTVMRASSTFQTASDVPIVEVVTSAGISVKCTPDHLFATRRGMVRADELTESDRMLVTVGAPRGDMSRPETPATIDEAAALIMGLVAGDGTITKSGRLVVELTGDDRELLPLVMDALILLDDYYRPRFPSRSSRPFGAPRTDNLPERKLIRVSSRLVADGLATDYGFVKATKHIVPARLLATAAHRPARFYVAGLAFADGNVNRHKYGAGSTSIHISQSNPTMLHDVQRILLSNGIPSAVYLRRAAGASYSLVISQGVYTYTSLIGFIAGHKQARLDALDLQPSNKKGAYTSVVSVTDAGTADVYCLREPIRRILAANGLTARRCAEQTLESYECCTLVETYLNRHTDLDDYLKTLKVAYLYAKTVTLLSTPWERTNAVMLRNRRIGASMSGQANFVDHHGIAALREWQDAGYREIRRLDTVYSEWLGIRESIKTTSVKPSGTVSLLAGESPGCHWSPGARFYYRTMRFSVIDPLLEPLRHAGYRIEPDVTDPSGTMVVYFPIQSPARRSEREVSIFEKAELAASAQRYWADNSVSVTLSFKPEEETLIGDLLRIYDGRFKTVSFLALGQEGAYKQMPYTPMSEAEYAATTLRPVDLSVLYAGDSLKDAEGEAFCTTDVCEMPRR